MTWRSDEPAKARGVLNDWDLAKVGNDPHKTSLTRTGTCPFLAIDLLTAKGDPSTHTERYDFESMFYALVWISRRYSAGKLVNKDALSDWNNPNVKILSDTKIAVFFSYSELMEPTNSSSL